MEFNIVPPILLGLFAGGVFSLSLGIHSKGTATEITHSLFGMTSMTLLKYVTLLIISFTIVIFTTFSILIRDVTFITQKPFIFIGETLAVSLFPSLIIFLMFYLRDKPISQITFIEYFLLTLKIATAHILLQISGVYTSVFHL
jgi:hypothetical protein